MNEQFTEAIRNHNIEKIKRIIIMEPNVKYIVNPGYDGHGGDESGNRQINRIIRDICALNDSKDMIFIIDLLDKSRILTIDNEKFEHDFFDYFSFALHCNRIDNAKILYVKYPVNINDCFVLYCFHYGHQDSFVIAKKILSIIQSEYNNVGDDKHIKNIKHFHPNEFNKNHVCLDVIELYHSISPFTKDELHDGFNYSMINNQYKFMEFYRQMIEKLCD
jgi:hypothetical protein